MKREYGPDIKIYTNRGEWGFPNERKYIVDAKWWRNWCDYTGFEISSQKSSKNSIVEQQQHL